MIEPNPVYYGAKPFFKKITFLFLNEDAAFAAAQAGTVICGLYSCVIQQADG